MDYQQVDSTSIALVGYDRFTATLEIHFHSGRHYRYFLVPARCYQSLLGADSKGRFFLQEIRPAGYPYTRLQ
jgi:hypothetical protein